MRLECDEETDIADIGGDTGSSDWSSYEGTGGRGRPETLPSIVACAGIVW